VSELYSETGIYDNLEYGVPFICKGLKCAAHLIQFHTLDHDKILCVGSGNAYEAVAFINAGYDVTVLEQYHPKIKALEGHQVYGLAQDMPFEDKEFDLVFCCETLEHVPEEETEAILKECKRVGKQVFFTIATIEDPPFNTHINIHGPNWWRSKFKRLGFKLLNFQYKPKLATITGSVLVSFIWANGVLVHAKC